MKHSIQFILICTEQGQANNATRDSKFLTGGGGGMGGGMYTDCKFVMHGNNVRMVCTVCLQ